MNKALAALCFAAGAVFALGLTLVAFGVLDSKLFMIAGGVAAAVAAIYAELCFIKALGLPPRSVEAGVGHGRTH